MNSEQITVWWGTGAIAKMLIEQYPTKTPHFFVDSCRNCGEVFFKGKPIYLPEEIANWKDLKVIIATDYYEEIIEKYHEKLSASEVYSYKEYFQQAFTMEELCNEVKQFIERINKENYKENILFFGDIVAYDRGTCRYVNKMNKELNGEILFISEADMVSEQYIASKISCKFMEIPKMFRKNVVYTDDIGGFKRYGILDNQLTEDYLNSAAKCMRMRHCNMTRDYEYFWVRAADWLIREILKVIKPNKVILWNKFYPFHRIIDHICKELQIETWYMEFGVLPGTFSLEKEGQMGESRIAKNPKWFNELLINEKDISEAKNVINYISANHLNRNEQKNDSEMKAVLKKLKKERPIILYAGQNDYESSLQPYDLNSKKYHSPYLKSTRDGLERLIDITKKNDWNLIYKPHPIMTKYESFSDLEQRGVITVLHANIYTLIELCDVCTTILSQVSYLSAISGKATVMFGYHQLTGSNAIYIAETGESMETVLKQALRFGFTEKQKNNFYEHVARMNKYYLYDDLTERNLRYGKKLVEL